MPYKHFWAGVGVALWPFKGGSATNPKPKRPHKPLWRGYLVALTDENINSGWKAIQSAPKSPILPPRELR